MSTATKKKDAATIKKETVVYVGPSLNGVVVRNTTFNNGITKELIQEIEKKPVLKSLMVPMSRLSEAVKQISNKQGAYYAFYQQALQEGE